MTRVFFRKADAGDTMVSGIVVSELQGALNGLLPQKIAADGIYGSATREAVRRFQDFLDLPVTGEMDDATWLPLMHTPEPSIFERCLQLTAHFEGTGFTKIVGNFDKAGLTWGIIGFTLSNGELGAVLTDISTRHPTIFNQAFGSDAAVILAKIQLPAAERVAWAQTITRPPRNTGVAEPWRTYFNDLGLAPEVQALQTRRARDVYWNMALRDARTFELGEELDFALFYDIAVQNGGMKSKGREAKVKKRFAASPDQSRDALRRIIEDVVVETSKDEFKSDVLQRKSTIRTGQGKVHGADYKLADWGLQKGFVPVDPES
jgi:peptidoglycan hydrolase-like protein with peptidoglycan-binding domain